MGWKGDLLVKTRYARAQEENDQLRANNSVLLQDGYELLARLNETRHERNDLIAMLDAANTKLEESMTERDTLAATVTDLTAELEEITLERNRINRGVARRQNRAVFNLPRPVDDSRLREMALATAAQFGHTGDGVTARARSYLDFLKGDAEPKQPTLADGEGVSE